MADLDKSIYIEIITEGDVSQNIAENDANVVELQGDISIEDFGGLHEVTLSGNDFQEDTLDLSKILASSESEAGPSGVQSFEENEIQLAPNEIVLRYLRGQMEFSEFFKQIEHIKTVSTKEDDKDGEEDEEEELDMEDDPKDEDYVPPSSAKKTTVRKSARSQAYIEENELDEDEDFIPCSSKTKTFGRSKKPKKLAIPSSDNDNSNTESPIKKRKKRRYKPIPKSLQGLMGEANLQFARGNTQAAIDTCMEIIKEAPKAFYPYQTLATIYESMGDDKKALEFTMLSAYLCPGDADLWQRVADMCLELNDIQGAIKAYNEGLKHHHDNYVFHVERAKLYEEMGETKKAMDCYKFSLPSMPLDQAEQYMDMARSLAESYYKLEDYDTTQKIMKNALEKHPEKITAEDVNLVLELLMQDKLYFESIEVIIKHCGVSFITSTREVWSKDVALEVSKESLLNQTIQIETCVIPELLPIDLRTKLAVCLIHYHQITVIPGVLGTLLKENVEELGDLFLDLAEAYMEEEYYADAKPILDALVHSVKFCLAAVWLRLAECYQKLDEKESAISAYSMVVSLAPLHVNARMALCSLQQELGKHDEALLALSHEDTDTDLPLTKAEQELLLQKCFLLYAQKSYESFIATAWKLLFHQFKDINSPAFKNMLSIYKSAKKRAEEIAMFMKGGAYLGFGKSEVPVDDLWDIYLKMCNLLVNQKRLEEFFDVTNVGMCLPMFWGDPRKYKQIEFMCLMASFYAKRLNKAFTIIRELCFKDIDNNQVWNLMSQVFHGSLDNRYNKFCMRYLLSHPDCLPIVVMNGHNAALSGTFLYALGEYIAALRQSPKDPLIHLCIGSVYFHLAGQRFTAKKHCLISQGLAFFNSYLELRGECQESYYNIARALHQLGLIYAATHFYEKVLDMKAAIGEEYGIFDLRREAAFNLSLIYESSESIQLARWVKQKYLVI